MTLSMRYADSKRWLTLFHGSAAFKVCYAYWLRRREMTMLDLEDFGPNPHVSDYGRFRAVQVRFAKGTLLIEHGVVPQRDAFLLRYDSWVARLGSRQGPAEL